MLLLYSHFSKKSVQFPDFLPLGKKPEQKPETKLNVLRESCLTKNISNGTLNLISK